MTETTLFSDTDHGHQLLVTPINWKPVLLRRFGKNFKDVTTCW